MKILLFNLWIAILFLFVLPASAFASTLYLSPGGGSISTGGVTSVQIRLNTGGDSVNGISAYLAYPADKLDVAWVSPSGAFSIAAENSYGGGIIKVSRGNFSGVSGNVNVATIGFRGKTPGKATVSFIGGSAAPRASDSSDSLNLGGSSGGTYTIVQGAAKPAKKSSSPVPSRGPVQILISDISTTAVSTNSAEINWKTSSEADSLVEYGLEKDKYFLTASNTEMATGHKLKLENSVLAAGLKVHFRIKSKDIDGNEVKSEDQLLQLIGYKVRIKVVDQKNNPLSGIEVMLYSDPLKATTDQNGEAVFDNVTLGKHLAVVTLPDGTKSASEIEVLETNALSLSDKTPIGTISAMIKINSSGKQSVLQQVSPQALAVVAFIAVLLAVTVIVVVIKKRSKKTPPSVPTPPAPPSSPPAQQMYGNNPAQPSTQPTAMQGPPGINNSG